MHEHRFGKRRRQLPRHQALAVRKPAAPHNDAYPLARPSQAAAAIATLKHEDQIHACTAQRHGWTVALAAELRALGVRTFPTHGYFFLADLAPHDAAAIAEQLRRRDIRITPLNRDIRIKPVNDAALGPGFMRITTALPEENRRFIDALAHC